MIDGSGSLKRSPGMHGLRGSEVLWISNCSGLEERLSPLELSLRLGS